MIRLISFGITFIFVRLFSLLPFFILNGTSWVIFQLLDKIIHYRKSIIVKNLKNAFPEKTDDQISLIKTEFYRYFARLIMENIKMFNLSLRKLERHIYLKNPEELERLFKLNKSVAAIAAHYGNWEWLLGLKKDVPHHTLGIYKLLNNKYFNSFFTNHRAHYGTEMINMREVPRILLKYARENTKTLTLYISDQSPVWEEIQYWTTFLNQDTPVYLGPEKLARKMKMAVIYFRVTVEKSNRYSVEAITITEDASKMQDYEITNQHLRLLQEDIRRNPQYWLWSHRRWKLTEKRVLEEKQEIYRFEGAFRKK
jgi:KDO2-lipid IV(A) lauroyltransferase